MKTIIIVPVKAMQTWIAAPWNLSPSNAFSRSKLKIMDISEIPGNSCEILLLAICLSSSAAKSTILVETILLRSPVILRRNFQIFHSTSALNFSSLVVSLKGCTFKNSGCANVSTGFCCCGWELPVMSSFFETVWNWAAIRLLPSFGLNAKFEKGDCLSSCFRKELWLLWDDEVKLSSWCSEFLPGIPFTFFDAFLRWGGWYLGDGSSFTSVTWTKVIYKNNYYQAKAKCHVRLHPFPVLHHKFLNACFKSQWQTGVKEITQRVLHTLFHNYVGVSIWCN